MTRPEWFDRAACKDAPVGLFHEADELKRTERRYTASVKACREFCDVCPVRIECLRYEFEQNEPLETSVVGSYPAAIRHFYRFGKERWRGEEED